MLKRIKPKYFMLIPIIFGVITILFMLDYGEAYDKIYIALGFICISIGCIGLGIIQFLEKLYEE